MTFLLDVNVVIALIDPGHVHNRQAVQWFTRHAARSWATSPITQNAVLRIVGNPSYPSFPGSLYLVQTLMQRLLMFPGHEFWPDDISLLDSNVMEDDGLLTSRQITDSYLLALAHAHHGQLATFDSRLVTHGIRGGKEALHLIPASVE